ncbi:helix-turn-helix transcriptional regulator [Streptomyces sp. NPDC050095]|uniref:helix-turn-helix domain-containing protein n=1 Tax=unclassified Streptomyces TaxID=2593676 RepID=UPI0034302FD7
MTTETTRRPDLGEALRSWRVRRRVSQLELATRAGTTQRHVSFIESGRSAPGRGMVVRLAEALQVPLRERNALLLAAGYAPAYKETRFGDPGLAAVRRALERIMEAHQPYPAVIIDRGADLVAANDAFHALTHGVDESLLVAPFNLARVLLHPRGLAPRIENFAEWAWHVVDALRDESADNPHPRTAEVLAELNSLMPERPARTDPDYLGYAVPLRLRSHVGELRLLSTLTRFGTAVDVTVAELRLEAFLPLDDETAQRLNSLAHHGRPGRSHRPDAPAAD